MMTSGNMVTKAISSTGLNPIPYDRNLYLTVTSPEGQDKEILGSKEKCQDFEVIISDDISFDIMVFIMCF